MGTRHATGWITANGKAKVIVQYAQYDGYPTGTGAALQEEIKAWNGVIPKEKMYAVKLVDRDGIPTPEERDKYRQFFQQVSTGKDWYALLREMQSSLNKPINWGIMVDGGTFLEDSLFCEWGYLVDLRTDEMVILKGFNQDPTRVPIYLSRRKPKKKDDYISCYEVWRGSLADFCALDMQAFQDSLDKDEAA